MLGSKFFIKMFLLVLLVFSTNQTLGAFQISTHTISSGATKMTGQRFQLNASIGQVDANTTLSSSRYQLSPGLWQQNNDLIFTNGFK